ncbi:nuclease [Luteimonas yindakuii]|nr:nuclease [Luteimonas yindakuii]
MQQPRDGCRIGPGPGGQTGRGAMRMLAGRLLLAMALGCGLGATAHAQVVVSQVYGAGGNSGAVHDADYVELLNRGDTPEPLGGRSLQYASATGTGNFGASATQLVALPDVSLAPGQYFLVGLAGGANGAPLPAVDASGTINMAAAAGKVALVEGTTSLGCNGGSTPCTSDQSARIVDLVGFGSANWFEGSGPAPALSAALAGWRADDGCTDSNDNAADFSARAPAPRNRATPALPCAGGGTPWLTIADTAAAEGDSGNTPFFFNVRLDRPAPAGGVRVGYATADGTATVSGDDYIAATGTVEFAEGETSKTVVVQVRGDTATEPDETFVVTLSSPDGAQLQRAEATGTILNDDVTRLAIHAIQGAGARSPYENLAVATEGIVTARRNNGFFLQTADGEDDGNPATSEGVFVFTSTAPPDAASVGNRVLVQGTVIEYVPAADPYQLPLTEITNASVVQLSSSHALPAPAQLTTALPHPDGALEQLEPLEGMRVSAADFTVVAPTGGNVNETQATATSNGRFAVVVTGTPRPFREAGLPRMDPDPLGSSAPMIPRWDFNPELIAVNSSTIGAPTANLAAGCRIVDGSLVGPLDYSFRRYTIYPEAELSVACEGADQPRPAQLPGPDHATFATYNLERFFDVINDPAIGEPVLTAEAFERRLRKASLAVRGYLHLPDILGVTEVENLATLQTLATRINADAIASGQGDPGYVAHLIEGNDVGGIDVGLLVRGGDNGAGASRVEVHAVTQEGADVVLANPDGSSSLLNDRPPPRLDATIRFADGRTLPVTAIVVHQRSLSGIEDDAGGANGWVSAGARVRAKRQAQAEFLAGLVQGIQQADPQRGLVVLGDFNAFEFNDGHVDAMGVVTGQPSPDNATAVDGDGVDLVEPDLRNTTLDATPDQRYSFVFDYQAQTLDHILVNRALLEFPDVVGHTISHARINADFPEIARNEADTPTRLSDHDPTLLLVRMAPVQHADLAVTAEANAAETAVGRTMAFAATLSNAGPDVAQFAGIGFALDAPLDDLEVDAPAGWSCDAPVQGAANTSLACTTDSLAASADAVFGLAATAPEDALGRDVTLAVAATSQTADPDESDNAASASTRVVEDPQAAPLLANGVPVIALSGDAGTSLLYRIELPPGARNLRVTSYGGSGDVTLLLRRDEPPTADTWDARSARPGNNEVVQIARPVDGIWYVRVEGVRDFARLTLAARWQP